MDRALPHPLHSARLRLVCAAAVGIASLALYYRTLAPTVTLVDSGELIVAARTLGIAHPPGFPLYILLAHAATLLPFADIAFRVNLASAMFAALAVAVLAAVVAEALLAVPHGKRPATSRATRARQAEEGELRVGAAVVPVLVSSLLLAFSRTLWSYATIAEVYTLNTLLILLVLLLMLRWRRRRADGWLYAAAFVFGLGLGVHHVTVGLTLPALAALVYATAGGAFFRSRRFVFAGLCATAGLSIYAYLPLAASRAPVLNWGNPDTFQRLWWHVTGRQYQAFMSFSPALLGNQAQQFVRLVSREFGPWWLPIGLLLAAVGFGALRRSDRPLFVCLLFIIAADLAYGLNYDIAEDKDAYYLPTFVTLAIAAGFGAQSLLHRLGGVRRRAPTAVLTAGTLLLVPLVALLGNFRFNDRSRYFIAHDYVDNILSTVAPGGLLLTLDWQVGSPMLYVRTIEERRRDVIVIDVNMLRRSWYFDYLRREYPELMESARSPVEGFLEDLRQWEQSPERYQRDRNLNQRIDSRFHEMILAFVSRHMRSGPVYVTQDVVLNRDTLDSPLARALTTTYQLVPQGLVFQLVADRAPHDPAEPKLSTRGLADGTLRFAADDVVSVKVLPVYVSMLYNRGRYLALYGRNAQAIDAFNQALALDARFTPAQRALSDSLRAVHAAEHK